MARIMSAIIGAILVCAPIASAGAPAMCRSGAPALCPSNAPAMVRQVPSAEARVPGPVFPCGPTARPECRERPPICDSIDPTCRDACARCGCVPSECGCYLGGGVWVSGVWFDNAPIIVPADVMVEVPSAPPAPVPAADQALIDLRAGRYALAAAEFLRQHTAQERAELDGAAAGETVVPDRSALRLHALALAGGGDVEGAARMFAQAYREDPMLAGDPLDGAGLLASRMELRRILVKAVRFAHQEHTFEAWSTVGYLMEAQGRFELARTMFARADAAN